VGVYSAYDRRTTGAQVDDEGIELRVSNRISERYGDKVHVNVTSYNRVVMLTGEVPTAEIRDELDKSISGLAGVRGVTNETKVGPHTAFSARANDSAITGKVKARFVDANRFNAVHVKVVTEDSTVYLLGIVTEKEGNAAAELARTTSGVRKVIKVFEYCMPTDDACRPREQPKSGEAKKVVVPFARPAFERKIRAPHEVAGWQAELSRPLVFTNGVFDLLHRGHVTYLAQARALGAALLVAVNGDASARRLGKGPGRPLNPLEDRMASSCRARGGRRRDLVRRRHAAGADRRRVLRKYSSRAATGRWRRSSARRKCSRAVERSSRSVRAPALDDRARRANQERVSSKKIAPGVGSSE
jgi:cytidyltransferase-like protein